MKSITLLASTIPPFALLLLFSVLFCYSGPAPAQDKETQAVHWRYDFNKARREATEKKLPIMIYFGRVDNPCCENLENNFFRDAKSVKLLNERFVALKINGEGELHSALMHALAVTTYPTLVFASHDGKIVPPAKVGYFETPVLYKHLLRVLESQNAQSAPSNR